MAVPGEDQDIQAPCLVRGRRKDREQSPEQQLGTDWERHLTGLSSRVESRQAGGPQGGWPQGRELLNDDGKPSQDSSVGSTWASTLLLSPAVLRLTMGMLPNDVCENS